MIIRSVEAKIWMALSNYLDGWLECKVMRPDEIWKPQASDTFLIVQDVSTEYGGVKPIDMKCGEPIDGFLNISVMYPTKRAWSEHKGMASRVCDFFMDAGRLEYEDATVTIRARPRLTTPARLDGAWNRCELSVPYRCWG